MLVRRANAFCSKSEYAALLNNMCLWILKIFSLDENWKYDTVKIDEDIRSSPQDFFNVNAFRATCFPLKSLQNFFCLNDIFIADELTYKNLDEWTKQSHTAKLLLWMWSVLFKRHNGKDMYNMLTSFYAAKTLSFDRDYSNSALPRQRPVSTSNQNRKENIPASSNNQFAGPKFDPAVTSGLVKSHELDFGDNSKRSTVVVTCFWDCYFKGDTRQSTIKMVRDKKICLVQFNFFSVKNARFCRCARGSIASLFSLTSVRTPCHYLK